MPNWVRNNVTVTGAPELVGALKRQVGASTQIPGKELIVAPEGDGYLRDGDGGYIYKDTIHVDKEPVLSFWNIVRPEGEALNSYAEGWYDWNCSNWGCKWDAKDVEVLDDSPGHWHVAFDTPWAPPTEVYLALTLQHPEVKIHVEWVEEQGFGAEEFYEGGNMETLREWNIPETHEQYEEVFGEESCYCLYAGESVDDYPYEDCPRPEGDTRTAVAELEKISELI